MHPQTLVNGIVVGLVADLEDPLNLGRIKVNYTFLGELQSCWARIATLMAGPDRGSLFRPEPEDEVLIAFELGSPDRPYIIGALWNEQDVPPAMGEEPLANDWRLIKSRSGHILKFNDKAENETIEIIDKDTQRKIILDSQNKKIEVFCDGEDGLIDINTPNGAISVSAKTKISVTCTSGDIDVTASNISVSAKESLSLSGSSVSIKADGTVTISGSTVAIN